jgi:hypothetical protein
MKLKMQKPSNFSIGANFFKKQLDLSNDYRMQLLRSKQRVNYLLTDQTKKMNLAKLSTPLGYLSFAIYYTRLLVSLSIIAHQLFTAENTYSNRHPSFNYSQLLNDAVWGTINFVEFFFWTFSRSVEAGRMGMSLEVFGLLMDLSILVIQTNQTIHNLANKAFDESDPKIKRKLDNQIHIARKNQIRIIIHLLTIAFSLSTIAFQLGISFPLSPVFFVTGIVSGFLRLKWAVDKESFEANIENKKPDFHSINKQFIDYLNRNILFPLALYLALSTFSAGLSFVFFGILLSKDLIPAIQKKHDVTIDNLLEDRLFYSLNGSKSPSEKSLCSL